MRERKFTMVIILLKAGTISIFDDIKSAFSRQQLNYIATLIKIYHYPKMRKKKISIRIPFINLKPQNEDQTAHKTLLFKKKLPIKPMPMFIPTATLFEPSL
jgi:hypothetical protein